MRLDEAVAAAQQRVAKLKLEVDADPAASTKRREAARQRAARETEARAVKAKAKLAEIAKERPERAKRSPKEIAGQKETRASLTDADARRMRLPMARAVWLQTRNSPPLRSRLHQAVNAIDRVRTAGSPAP